MKSLVLLRNDLRMDDNPALKHACLNSDEVPCLYLYQPDQMKLHNVASCKIEFIIENLKDLESSLNKINVPLTVITSKCFDDCPNLIIDVINKRSIKKVYWNNQFGFDEQRRDSAVKDVLDRNNIYNESFDDLVIYPPGTIRTMEGKPYSVFTPFKRRWIENFNMDFLDIEFKYTGSKRGWIGDSPLVHLDISKANSFGWNPKVSIKEGIINTLDYLTSNKNNVFR